MVEVRGVEPLCPRPSRAASTCVASDWISPPGRDDARSSLSQPWFEDTSATSRRPSPIFLLSTLLATSRCHGRNVAAIFRQPEAFLRMCRLFVLKGDSRESFALDRQLRALTKGRIRNTPKSGKEQAAVLLSTPSKNLCLRPIQEH